MKLVNKVLVIQVLFFSPMNTNVKYSELCGVMYVKPSVLKSHAGE